ncbi:MAG: hydantoinase B/oxoprolinase family protein [Actinobacteria bacterium]|nr:hydantoinase B/oxoprolinase family protein [Actinomycetota bacterium]
MSPDPITLEIIAGTLQAISDEMFASIRKTAMSSIIYEVLDMGTAVTDGEGELASSGAGIPGFVGTLDKAVKAILAEHPEPGAIAPGDVFATNDPFFGGVTHLNDIVVVMPVFVDGSLIAWTANIAHHNDVGGLVPGSISGEARELFQEGLRIPAVKIIAAGEPIEPVFKLLAANTRLPEFLEGDLWACIAALRLGERRLGEVARKYGVETFEIAVRAHLEHGEAVSRRALAELPKGRFEFSEEQENGAVYKVVVEITEDEFVVDLRDNPDQDEGPYNSSYDGAEIAAQMIFKSATESDVVANAGTFRPLRVLTRPGSVFDAQLPAAFAIYSEVEIRLYDLIWRCLAEPLGRRLPAGGFTSVCGTFISGRHPDTGRHFTIVEPQLGGWGASDRADGNSALFSATHGDTFNCPAEIAEVRYGLLVDQLALNPQAGGEGAHRGGKGIVVDYRVREDGIFLTCAFTRYRNHPWAVDGGLEGGSNYVEVIRADGSREEFATVTGLPVNAGDVIRIHTANGAGYGDPKERPVEQIRADVELGYLSPERAVEVYGIDPAALPAEAR